MRLDCRRALLSVLFPCCTIGLCAVCSMRLMLSTVCCGADAAGWLDRHVCAVLYSARCLPVLCAVTMPSQGLKSLQETTGCLC